jgi:hypothetical protein
MYNPETDLLFPPRTLLALRDLRGTPWWNLVTSVLEAGQDSLEQMAFVLMMARMNNCATCNADSFRAMTGCATCSTQTLRRFHESDGALTSLYQAARGEVELYLQEKNILLSR